MVGLAVIAAGWVFYMQPPEGYRGDALALVKYLNRADITAYCISLGAPNEPDIAACARGSYIVLPNPCEWPLQEAYAELACHELGHRDGWRHETDPRFQEPPH